MITRKDIGERVQDGAGRVGILRDVIPDWEDPAEWPSERRKRRMAFVAPEGGGREWLLPPTSLTRARLPGAVRGR
ncbi:hypothetical protein [Streptomyces cinereoruber]|uniref:hypothetical protein n=1 Tax=Streptomyces cinereoruber TaxID=67260 RepID=UPI0036301C82